MGEGKERKSFVRRGDVHRRFGDQKKRNVILKKLKKPLLSDALCNYHRTGCGIAKESNGRALGYSLSFPCLARRW
jgi:hypothetical protein